MPTIQLTYGTEIEFYGYREASVADLFMVVPRDSVAELEKLLFERVGENPQNHATFRLLRSDDSALCVKFTDFSAQFGATLLLH